MIRLLLLCMFLTTYSFAQITVQGVVKDAQDKSPLSFCSVAVTGTGKGTLTNEDGAFSITAEPGETLAFFYLGYKKKSVSVADIQKNGEVLMTESVNKLDEVTVRYDEERLYNILLACKKELQERKAINTKAYYQLETKINDDPVEMLECYYNARVKGATIESLLYKNGRVGLSKYDGRFFASMNTSKAIQYLDLTKESPYLPDIPLQLTKAKMMAEYKLSELPADETSYHIAFKPTKNKRAQFTGDIWIDKETSAIMKIEMTCDSAAIHPFKADGLDKLGYVSLSILHTYQQEYGPGPLNHIDFTYQFDYIDRYKADNKVMAKAAKRARTKGVIYFYDFRKPFVLPHYNYDVNDEDYQKIAMFPYNSFFWDYTERLVHTKEQQASLDFIAKNGQLMNFNGSGSGKNKISYSDFIEPTSILWSDTTRVIMTRRNNDDMSDSKKYQVKAQIYLDINKVGDSVHHFSVSVFDIKRTYFSTYPDDKINAFVNIYFDLYEIERLKMEDELEARAHTVEEIDEIFQKTKKRIAGVTSQYKEEVNMGQNLEAMRKWNIYVREALEIDNLKVFNLNW